MATSSTRAAAPAVPRAASDPTAAFGSTWRRAGIRPLARAAARAKPAAAPGVAKVPAVPAPAPGKRPEEGSGSFRWIPARMAPACAGLLALRVLHRQLYLHRQPEAKRRSTAAWAA